MEIWRTVKDLENGNYEVVITGMKPAGEPDDGSEWILKRIYFDGQYHHQDWLNMSVERYLEKVKPFLKRA